MEDTLSKPEYETNDEMESEDEDNSTTDEEFEEGSTSFMRQITNLLESHKEVNSENALALNQEMQRRLKSIRESLEGSLKEIQEHYKRLELKLTQKCMTKKRNGIGIQGAYLKGGTFYRKGNMFFKDVNNRNCPNNPDYEHRKAVNFEMFPMDFNLCARHVWSVQDKVALVYAVKEQVIEFMSDEENRNFQKVNQKKCVNLHSEKLVNLLANVDKKFRIDWQQISDHDLRSRHSVSSCEAMWCVYLQPTLNHSAWTDAENQRLLEVASEHNYVDWKSIAAAIGDRSDYQCFVQYMNTVCFMQSQRWERWNKQDDKGLLTHIKNYTNNGVIDWNGVAAHFPHKPKREIQARYNYSINPEISHEPFRPEEDVVLLGAVKYYDGKFKNFPRTLFPNRSLIQLRARYTNTLKNRNKIQPWSVDDDEKLINFVNENGASAWMECANMLGNHSRTSCRTRYLTIQKFLEKNPDKAIENIPRKKCIRFDNQVTPDNFMKKFDELIENKDQDKSVVEALYIKKRDKKKLYIDKLRTVERSMYTLFKYGYNFRLGEDRGAQLPDSTYSMNIVAIALDSIIVYEPTPNSPNFNRNMQLLNKVLQRTNDETILSDTRLPPSWSTAMGFRTLCVHTSVDTKEITPEERSALNENEAVQIFRKRFRALFHKCALISRLNPTKIKKFSAASVAEQTEVQANTTQQMQQINDEPDTTASKEHAHYEPISIDSEVNDEPPAKRTRSAKED